MDASQTATIVGSATGVATIPPNRRRSAILLTTPPGRTTLLAFGNISGSSQGVPMSSGMAPLLLTIERLGEGIGDAITLTDSLGASQTYTYIEFNRIGKPTGQGQQY
jgi:hypothetical protein